MKIHRSTILIALSFILNFSCQTMMNTGIPGSERGLLHPYNKTDQESIDFSFSGQIGTTVTGSGGGEASYFAGSNYAKGNIAVQWQNVLWKKSLCGSSSFSAWTGKLIDSPYTEYDQYVTSTDDTSFSGGAIALRLGNKKWTDSGSYSVPSLELLYAFERGQYFEFRKHINNEKLGDLDTPINMKSKKSSMRLSLIPLDRTIFLRRSALRISYAQGWSDQWLQTLTDTISDKIPTDWNTLVLVLPSYYSFDFSFQPFMSKLFFSFNWSITNYYHENDISSNLGLSLGAGYILK